MSTRADLAAWAGMIGGCTDRRAHHDGSLDADRETAYFQEWLRQGGSGCLFAQNRAAPSRAADERDVLHGREQGDATYRSLAIDPTALTNGSLRTLQRELIEARKHDAVLIHLPAPTTAVELASAVARLARSEFWFAHSSLTPDASGHVLVMLRWPVPGTFVHSEVLGFADLPFLPPTRRSPTTTLVLRVTPPPSDQPTAHIAQMPFLAHEDDHIDFYWQGTRQARAALTPAEFDESAQAPITFRFPADVWDRAREERP